MAITLAHDGVGEWLAVRESTGRVIDGRKFEASGHSGFRQRGFHFSPVPKRKLLTPDSRDDDYRPAASNHFREFVDAIQTGGTTLSNIADVGGLMNETLLLGNFALWADKKIEWGAASLSVKNQPDLASAITPKDRAGDTL